jgi:hypothetical protein
MRAWRGDWEQARARIRQESRYLRPCRASDRNPFHLVERDLITGAIVELGGARTLARGHGLSIL